MYQSILKQKAIVSSIFFCGYYLMLRITLEPESLLSSSFIVFYIVFPIVFFYGGLVSFLSDYLIIKRQYPYYFSSLCFHLLGGLLAPIVILLVAKPEGMMSSLWKTNPLDILFNQTTMAGVFFSSIYWVIDILIRWMFFRRNKD
ncbi:hypothetical protein [Baia soyae]|uniref:Uncharacterized protein n=1 Tax=Baia soyae TaxID=1544746 RepID=A0A4R2RUY7_9BACL|nr:hypothetical protein [Baia soyae]TCP66497.1 hypothetical protein EDD57_1222 [Baia soyae]